MVSRRRTISRRGFVAGLALGLCAWSISTVPVSGGKITDGDCLDCHDDLSLSKTVDGKTVSLTVPPDALKKSAHERLHCVDCHGGIKELPHSEKLPVVACSSCHEKEAREYATSIHGVSRKEWASAAAGCKDCHGSHNILPSRHPESLVFKLNLPRTCARCHSNPGITDEYRMKQPHAASQYAESIHGLALVRMGLIVAPSCNDCHGVHAIQRSVDRNSPIHHSNIARTCGKCHVGIESVYRESVHGRLLANGDRKGPVCIDCHSAHKIESPIDGHLKAVSDQRCGRCHQDRLEHYRDTYHGKAMALGRPNVATHVAACYDCHGFHDVLPASDSRSHLSKENIVKTCQRCHAGAGANFADYLPHANPLDRQHYPGLHMVFLAMTGLLVGTFAFFGIHTLFWIFRSIWLYLHDSKTFREAKVRGQVDGEWFTRFTPFQRFLHFLVVTSFLLLVITGMPLKFYYTDWAKALFRVIGGTEVARSLHHFGALVTFLYFGLHLLGLAGIAWKRRSRLRDPSTGKIRFAHLWRVLFGPDSMVPTIQDWRDFIAHQKWFFGKGERPAFDRWTYWEKFDYFAVFWGVFMIGLSGLIMWFPLFFTRFLPGWIINVALIVHSDEALLAAGFIFTFHFFNTHFRIEKFPMDTVIFSGRISKTEMLHERKRWHDRLVAENRLDDYRIRDEWARWKNIAKSFGYAFFGIGVILLILIIYAMTSRLAH